MDLLAAEITARTGKDTGELYQELPTDFGPPSYTLIDAPAQEFLRTDQGARPLYHLMPGKSVRVETDDDGRLKALRYLAQGGALLSVERRADGFLAASAPPGYDVRTEVRAGEIRSSLFGAADAVGPSDA
jgi:hypothetical protein